MKYRKKPVVIEAVEWTGEYTPEIHKFLGDIAMRVIINKEKKQMLIPTLEGQMLASEGDFVIRGIKGEYYPCKPDIFTATYELADAIPLTGKS